MGSCEGSGANRERERRERERERERMGDAREGERGKGGERIPAQPVCASASESD